MFGRAGEFEANWVIDVSHDRQYYALSLLVAREQNKRPIFVWSAPVQNPVIKEQSMSDAER